MVHWEVDGRDLLPEEDSDGEIPEDELFARAVLASEMLAVDLENAEHAAAMAGGNFHRSQLCPH